MEKGEFTMKRQLAVRLSQPLNKWIVEQAAINNRSLNRQMVLLLEQERSSSRLAKRCFGNMHLFATGNVCNCGKAAKVG